jgi:TolA-binding protein
MKQTQDEVQALQQEMQELEQELQTQTSEITGQWEDAVTKFESVPIRPNRTDVRVSLFALAWTPHWQIKCKSQDGTVHDEIVPAYI